MYHHLHPQATHTVSFTLYGNKVITSLFFTARMMPVVLRAFHFQNHNLKNISVISSSCAQLPHAQTFLSCIVVLFLNVLHLQDGATPLYISCEKGHFPVIERLIAAKADVNLQTKVQPILYHMYLIAISSTTSYICGPFLHMAV